MHNETDMTFMNLSSDPPDSLGESQVPQNLSSQFAQNASYNKSENKVKFNYSTDNNSESQKLQNLSHTEKVTKLEENTSYFQNLTKFDNFIKSQKSGKLPKQKAKVIRLRKKATARNDQPSFSTLQNLKSKPLVGSAKAQIASKPEHMNFHAKCKNINRSKKKV